MSNLTQLAPDIKISVNQIFGIETDMKIDAFSKKNEFVPEIDSNYKFDRDTTLALISGFSFNNFVSPKPTDFYIFTSTESFSKFIKNKIKNLFHISTKNIRMKVAHFLQQF